MSRQQESEKQEAGIKGQAAGIRRDQVVTGNQPHDDSAGTAVRAVLGGLGVLAGAAYAVYLYQPVHYELLPRTPPADNPWTDPDSARLFRPGTRVAAITAHPDDSEFYIGGLLTRLGASGALLSLIVTTDGDKGYYLFEDAARNRRVRRQEQETAASMWGAVEVTFLGFPDGRFFATQRATDTLAAELGRLNPEYVVTFDPEFPPRRSHRDHRQTGLAAVRAARRAGVGDWLLQFSTRAANFAIDVTAQWPRKVELLRVHESQFYGKRLGFIEQIVAGSARSYGRLIDAEYAEGLRCMRLQ